MESGLNQIMKFVTHYHYKGHQWSLIINAYDWTDAELRCQKLGLKLDGELKAVVPNSFGSIAKIFCAVRNFFK